MSDAQNDQRQEFRLSTAMTVFIELPSAGLAADPEIIITRSLDLSANGLRVIADRELLAGNILRTCVQTQSATGEQLRFTLITEVKWVRPYGAEQEFLLGLSLYESEGSDIASWKAFVARCCDSEFT
ncbi:PilZ domain-containing protein [Simiduia aestuariiviva]|uniref:PilZ domain-containing protein n=1 Tax=Simiduia aestuariiviva TaxID=1510459 RepID=A0A839UJ98_9GAMM|nr:PilZ domain-containing protein [Simiduia aestuariiviva]MBB3167643.1 hypothetical protein [Simiduia aestuariiviva]